MDKIDKIIEKFYNNRKKITLDDLIYMDLTEVEYLAIIEKLTQEGFYVEEEDRENFEVCSNITSIDSYFQYVKEMEKFPKLTKDEEFVLFKQYKQDKDIRIKNKLIESNLQLVVDQSKIYLSDKFSGLDIMDLIQEGNSGLIYAIENFDLTKGCKFSTFAVRNIRQRMTRVLNKYSRQIKLPERVIDQIKKISEYMDYIEKTTGIKPSEKNISENLGTKIEIVRNSIEAMSIDVISLDEETNLIEQIPCESIEDDEIEINGVTPNILKEIIKKVLSDREYYILSARFGIVNDVNNDLNPKTQQQIANELGNLTRERVRQLEAQALKKLKKYFFPKPKIDKFYIKYKNK